ncbi:MAG: glycoside hydrolase family 43 protein [Tannerella sp.]|nr:glycoside hydrolase family 43 protein [Tannerella sp.]
MVYKSFYSLWVLICLTLSASGQQTYRNPVLAGDIPDPSVIRVGDTYYVAGTSSEWAPPYRLYESKDLVNWTYLGGLFKEMPSWTMGSYWAPELFYHNDTYYVYYTARRASDRKSFIGVATTSNIKEGFTDHGVIVEWTNEAIDAYVLEVNGELYITWKAYGLDRGKTIEILGAKLSDDGLKLAGDAFTMLTAERDTWEAGGIEGQCLVEHNGYIYMFYSGNGCCGRNCNYMTGVARSKTITGPWEKYEGNPILYGDDRFRCPGHGTLVETPDNRYFFVYHAYDAAAHVFLGRQGMMEEVIWDKATGWPSFRYGRTPSLQAESPNSSSIQQQPQAFIDNFQSSRLRNEWIWDVSKPKPEINFSQNTLIILGNETPVGSFLGLRILKSSYRLTVELPGNEMASTIGNSGATAQSRGICIYGTSENACGLSVESGNIVLWQVKQGSRTVISSKPVESYPLTLSVQTRFGQYCQFGLMEQNRFQPFGQLINLNELPQWDRPPMIGLQARGNAKSAFTNVLLTWE